MLAVRLEPAVAPGEGTAPKDVLGLVDIEAATIAAVLVERTRSAGSASTGVVTEVVHRAEGLREARVQLATPVGARVPDDDLVGLRAQVGLLGVDGRDGVVHGLEAVSYTHLDVYKRQGRYSASKKGTSWLRNHGFSPILARRIMLSLQDNEFVKSLEPRRNDGSWADAVSYTHLDCGA